MYKIMDMVINEKKEKNISRKIKENNNAYLAMRHAFVYHAFIGLCMQALIYIYWKIHKIAYTDTWIQRYTTRDADSYMQTHTHVLVQTADIKVSTSYMILKHAIIRFISVP